MYMGRYILMEEEVLFIEMLIEGAAYIKSEEVKRARLSWNELGFSYSGAVHVISELALMSEEVLSVAQSYSFKRSFS